MNPNPVLLIRPRRSLDLSCLYQLSRQRKLRQIDSSEEGSGSGRVGTRARLMSLSIQTALKSLFEVGKNHQDEQKTAMKVSFHARCSIFWWWVTHQDG